MRFGVSLPTKDDYGDIHRLVELAIQTEESGWDGFFLWDHVSTGRGPLVDPWIAMAAVASQTTKLRLGLLVTPLSRRRPWKVAREIVSLDHLSLGRMILGVGLGDFKKKEFEAFGEISDQRIRGQMLDEGLEIITGLQSGEPFIYAGEHYQISLKTVFNPKPIQEPRVPVWVAGKWPNKLPFRRAALWDGAVPIARGRSKKESFSLDEVRELIAYIAKYRTTDDPFDLCLSGVLPATSPAEDRAIVERYLNAGVTWWIEFVYSGTGSPKQNLERIRLGPPKG
jgi:alkanesulfonate monooxygenase SsuD/methylene tetrahydromethanopterin reductase-like flavin-dependent oxidoreductase (luciferase family)